MTDTDNYSKADRVVHLQEELSTYSDSWNVRTNLIAVLTDARHWCDANRESYAELDRIAHQHHAAEAVAERKSRT